MLKSLSNRTSTKERIGCTLHELIPSYIALTRGKGRWRSLCNRNEPLESRWDSGVLQGCRCRWEHSSELTVTRVFPSMANRIFDASFSQLGFCWEGGCDTEQPAVSVLMPIGGKDRNRLLAPCLASLCESAKHVRSGVEILLIHESGEKHVADQDLAAFGIVHTSEVPKQPTFNKSLMLNAAAERARGEVLVIHDADLIASPTYLNTCLDRCRDAESARPGRLIFYLDENSTDQLVTTVNGTDKPTCLAAAKINTRDLSFERVVQNTPNPMAVRRDTYFAIGGHDEDFQGWGGEDLEFLSRLRTRPIDEFGAEPLVHLWHPASPKKASGDRNQQLQDGKLAIAADERIRRLMASNETNHARQDGLH